MRSPLDQLIYDATRGLADAPPGTKLIRLTKGLFAVVDEQDFERVNAFKWHAHVDVRSTIYAMRAIRVGLRRQMRVRMDREIIVVPKDLFPDHRDGNGLNNCRENLRICTRTQNNQNRRGFSTLGLLKGVRKVKNRFQGKITINKRRTYIGSFLTETEAALAYDKAAKLFFGEFARLNFPVHQRVLSDAQTIGVGEHSCVEGANPP